MSAVGFRGVRGGGGLSTTRPPAAPCGMAASWLVVGASPFVEVPMPFSFVSGLELEPAVEVEGVVVSRIGFGSSWDRVIRKNTMRMKTAATMARRELIMVEVGRIEVAVSRAARRREPDELVDWSEGSSRIGTKLTAGAIKTLR